MLLEIKNSSDTKRTIQALVVPGIGSFGFVMQKLKKEQLDKFILDKINQGIPGFFYLCRNANFILKEL